MTKRKIIKIDEEKCNGCGLCVPNCAEGAIKIISGKARIVSEASCDGLGACLGHCPQGAITIEEREAVEFKETVCRLRKSHFGSATSEVIPQATRGLSGCPGSKVLNLGRLSKKVFQSQLSNWPIQIRLVPTDAPYFNGADILVAADCVPFAYPEFHEKLLRGKVLLVGCPKLDDLQLYKEKIGGIIKDNDIKSIAYAHMEVPCCSGLVGAIKEAIEASGKKVPFTESVISVRGEKIK